MKVFIFSLFSFFYFWISDNSVPIIDDLIGSTTTICFDHKGKEHCDYFDDGSDCTIWFFDEGDSSESFSHGEDCGEEVP